MAVQDDLAWFEQNRAFIARQYQGQYVLISGKTVKGSYPSYEAAFSAGMAQFGAGNFAVKKALEKEPVVNI